ncbi:MAG: alanine/glycine:cation symporter family protein [Tissierellaceae bacterium]|nr:alanine/glycine:cation symporter family protein [Tissierellaceae bacterium]
MNAINNFVLDLGTNLWNIVLVLAIIVGAYYAIKSKFIQAKLFPESIRLIKRQLNDDKQEGSVTGIQALAITLGGAIGTGNVAGVAMAIVYGGPGAVFWMWLIALFSMLTSFLENTLSQLYKEKEGLVFRGGPMYYMEKALGKRWIGVIYSISMIISLGFALAALQNNTITLSFGQSLNIPREIISAIVTILIGIVIFGGVTRIARVAETSVPFMTIVYLLISISVLLVNFKDIPNIFILIFKSAFNFKAAGGGLIGATIYNGLKRGIFSNGAGQGDAPTAGGSSNVKHPAEQGILGTFAVFIDTIVVCTLTALIIISSGVYVTSDLVGIELTQFATTSQLGSWVGIIFSLCIGLFCFTSIMSNYYCGETSLTYLSKGMKGRNFYRIIFVISIFLGGITEVDLMWNIADLFCALIFLINLGSLLFLGNISLNVAKDYFNQKKYTDTPIFNPDSIKELKDKRVWSEIYKNYAQENVGDK